MLHSVGVRQGDARDVRWDGASGRRFAAAVFLGFNRRWRWRRRYVHNTLGPRDAGEVRDEESRRASYADYRDRNWDAEAISHGVPGRVLEALRFGLKARRASEANSAAFM